MSSKAIAEKVGSPVTVEEVEALMRFAGILFDQVQSDAKKLTSGSERTPYDYTEYGKYREDDLPLFSPQPGKRGPKEKPVRMFLRHFFPIIEYMMSSTHERIEDRVAVKKANWWVEGGKRVHDGGTKVAEEDQFDALNQLGKLAFLITKEFYPNVSIGGKTDRSKNRDGDFHAVLHPKGLPYQLTPREVQRLKEMRTVQTFLEDLIAERGLVGCEEYLMRDPVRWEAEVAELRKQIRSEK
ncbi:MAG: hypothetical protein AAF667_13045 [Pseudomonadota bacterium]